MGEKIKKSFSFFVPVIFAGLMAVVQSIGEQKEARRIDDMEARIEALEASEEETEES